MVTAAAVLSFLTAALEAWNHAQANKPPDQVRAEAALAWAIARPVLRLILPSDVKATLEAQGVKL